MTYILFTLLLKTCIFLVSIILHHFRHLFFFMSQVNVNKNKSITYKQDCIYTHACMYNRLIMNLVIYSKQESTLSKSKFPSSSPMKLSLDGLSTMGIQRLYKIILYDHNLFIYSDNVVVGRITLNFNDHC